jgi:mRNA deadenylase 3'-5' endonuclease subunit Ccr4
MMRRLRCVSYNALADAWLGCGSYAHVPPELLRPGARLPHLVRLISDLNADVVCLQEVEPPLVEALGASGDWQLFWSWSRLFINGEAAKME